MAWSPKIWPEIFLMEEILHQLIGSFKLFIPLFTCCFYFYLHPKWLFGISEPSAVPWDTMRLRKSQSGLERRSPSSKACSSCVAVWILGLLRTCTKFWRLNEAQRHTFCRWGNAENLLKSNMEIERGTPLEFYGILGVMGQDTHAFFGLLCWELGRSSHPVPFWLCSVWRLKVTYNGDLRGF